MKKLSSFALLLLLVSALALSACNNGNGKETEADTTGHTHTEETKKPEETEDTTKEEETTKAPDTTEIEDTTKVPDTTKTEDTTQREPAVDDPIHQELPHVKDDFENCLFIGDSRTVGFLKYSNTGKAEVFASTGMNVFRIAKEEVTVNGEVKTLDGVLSAKKYEKIYLMLGINEIGYDLDRVLVKYGEIVDIITKAQPQAKLYIQANLHILHERSIKDKYYNNDRLNYINDGIKKLTDGKTKIYLDVNPIFDDANGGMKAEIAYDDFHPKGRYYTDWLNWIADNS